MLKSFPVTWELGSGRIDSYISEPIRAYGDLVGDRYDFLYFRDFYILLHIYMVAKRTMKGWISIKKRSIPCNI